MSKLKSKEKNSKPRRRQKKQYTYAEAHNRAFWAFNKASRIMVWAGIINVIGLMMAVVQTLISKDIPLYFRDGSFYKSTLVYSEYQYPLCYAICDMIFRFLELPPQGVLHGPAIPEIAYMIIVAIISMVVSSITVFISIKASEGKKWALFGQSTFYLIDTGLIIALHLMGEYGTVIWIMFGIHMIIMFFIATSIYQYYQLQAIEKTYPNSMTNKPELYENKKKQFSMMSNSTKPSQEEKLNTKEAEDINTQETTKGDKKENGTRINKK